MKQSIEEYLERLKAYGYTEEQLKEVRDFQSEAEHMSFEIFTELHINQRLVRRTVKLKKPRNLYVIGERIFYLNHYHKAYLECGYFHTEYFLEQRKAKEAENPPKKVKRKRI